MVYRRAGWVVYERAGWVVYERAGWVVSQKPGTIQESTIITTVYNCCSTTTEF